LTYLNEMLPPARRALDYDEGRLRVSAETFDQGCDMDGYHQARLLAGHDDDDLDAARGIMLGALMSALIWVVLLSA
jgi:hypothetical protein